MKIRDGCRGLMNSTPSIDTYSILFCSVFSRKKRKIRKILFQFSERDRSWSPYSQYFFSSPSLLLSTPATYTLLHNDPAGLKPGTAASAVWLNFKYSMTPIQYLKDDADSSHQKKLYCTYSLSCTLSTQLPLPGGWYRLFPPEQLQWGLYCMYSITLCCTLSTRWPLYLENDAYCSH